ncbi:YrhB domain-containing protein [Lysobacter capsici]|uniref:YrhB domain-containing protein n=1 Tax=Lysobacter capsici TaxID=435897 RepID=UPI000627EC46|nr:YrhB domain-containing protein [Lysobacter capsici]
MAAIDFEAARHLAQTRIASHARQSQDEFVLVPEHTQEIARGWVFFYNSREFVETGNASAMLAGNGPILVERDGTVIDLPTHCDWEDAIRTL